jgi:hypothetical protein
VDDPYPFFIRRRPEAANQPICDLIQTPLEFPKPQAIDIEADVSSFKMARKNGNVAAAGSEHRLVPVRSKTA